MVRDVAERYSPFGRELRRREAFVRGGSAFDDADLQGMQGRPRDGLPVDVTRAAGGLRAGRPRRTCPSGFAGHVDRLGRKTRTRFMGGRRIDHLHLASEDAVRTGVRS